MKIILCIVAVLLAYYGLWVGMDHVGAGTILETIWGYALLFMTEFILVCVLPVIARYIIRREPFKNAKELCFGCATIYIGVLTRSNRLAFIDLAIATAGICFGAWVSYRMLSK